MFFLILSFCQFSSDFAFEGEDKAWHITLAYAGTYTIEDWTNKDMTPYLIGACLGKELIDGYRANNYDPTGKAGFSIPDLVADGIGIYGAKLMRDEDWKKKIIGFALVSIPMLYLMSYYIGWEFRLW